MKKLDRLGWAEGIGISAFGVHTGIRVNRAGILPRVLPLLPPGWKKNNRATVQRLYSLVVPETGQRAGLRRMNMLYADNVRIARDTDMNQCWRLWKPTRTGLHCRSRTFHDVPSRWWVCWKDALILLPAEPERQNHAGPGDAASRCKLLSDEYAVVDDFWNGPSVYGCWASGKTPCVHPVTKYNAETFGAASGIKTPAAWRRRALQIPGGRTVETRRDFSRARRTGTYAQQYRRAY